MSNLKDYQNKTQKLFQVLKSEFERLPILSFKTKWLGSNEFLKSVFLTENPQ